jgi:hypothetical protein
MGAALVMAQPSKKRKDRAVKVEEEIAVMASTMCAYRKIPVAEYLSRHLRPLVEKDFEAFKRELNQAEKPKK